MVDLAIVYLHQSSMLSTNVSFPVFKKHEKPKLLTVLHLCVRRLLDNQMTASRTISGYMAAMGNIFILIVKECFILYIPVPEFSAIKLILINVSFVI